MSNWGKPGTAKAWCRRHVTFVRVPRGEQEIRCFCAQARAATDADARARMIVQLLGLGHLADPALDREADDALAALNAQAPAIPQLPVLNANEPEGIIRWCRYVLSQPADRAIVLSRPLHPVMGRLTDEAAPAVGRVLRWAMFKERPQPR
jgi:hypothetical protein